MNSSQSRKIFPTNAPASANIEINPDSDPKCVDLVTSPEPSPKLQSDFPPNSQAQFPSTIFKLLNKPFQIVVQ
jgi:hypothetical protein